MKKSALKQLIKEAIEEVKPKVEEEVLNEGFSPETDEIGAFYRSPCHAFLTSWERSTSNLQIM
jgi:hypothetical protein